MLFRLQKYIKYSTCTRTHENFLFLSRFRRRIESNNGLPFASRYPSKPILTKRFANEKSLVTGYRFHGFFSPSEMRVGNQ